MAQLLGTVLASPVVQGNSDLDSYGTHYSHLGIGGYQEFSTTDERDAIPVKETNELALDGLSSGRRRLGMLVYVSETDIVYKLNVPYSSWTGLTDTQKVSALADNNNWIVFSNGVGGDAIKKSYYEPAHGFIFGDVVGFNGSNYVKKLATAFDDTETIGMVSRVDDVDNFTITYAGFIDLTPLTGLSANTVYFVSPVTAGAITPDTPVQLYEENRPILITQTSTTGLIVQYRGQIITEATSGTTGTTVLDWDNIQNKPDTFPPTLPIPISGVTGLQTALDNKIESSLIGAPNGVTPLNGNTEIPIQYIPRGLKEIFVVANLTERDARFYASGDTGTTGQTESFEGLRVFVLDADPEFSGSSEYIDTTGFLTWSATTNTTNIIVDWYNITNIPPLVNTISGGTGIIVSSITGDTVISTDVDNIYIENRISDGKLSIKNSSIDVTRFNFQGGESGSTGYYLIRGTGTTVQAVSGVTIGAAEDGTYTDGLYTDFITTTPVGTAVDRFNEILKQLVPSPAPDFSNITSTSLLVSGFLSFGSSKSIAGYTNVGTNALNVAVDINEDYAISGTRLGITNSTINGILNDATVGGVSDIPYPDNSFGDAEKGKLVLSKNGVVVSQLILSGTTAATSNNRISVSVLSSVKFQNGNDFDVYKYRTGTYTIPTSAMTNGYNYITITHSGSTFSRVTNYLEWVYDADATSIALLGSTGLTNPTLNGNKYISGVKYHTGGTVQYQGTFSNVYKNVYSNSSTAIDFPSKENLGSITLMDVTGAGIVDRLSSALQTLPLLDLVVTNPQNNNISIVATLPINATKLFGNIGSIGRVRSSVSVLHPIAAQQYSGGQSTLTGFLLDNTTQSTDLNYESFNGEIDRLEAREYTGLTYTNVNGGSYAWSSNQNLISGNAQHNTGLLVFNSELMYPNASYLTSTYGITAGDFSSMGLNAPVGNPNYSAASGIRSYYRKFKSANGSTQSVLTFAITHTGTNTDFITGGTPSGNNIKMEFLIMRSGGEIHGWANPFASSGNPEGISNTSSSHGGGITTVTCTLSTTPRVANNDIVIVRLFTSSGYTNRILNLAVTNI